MEPILPKNLTNLIRTCQNQRIFGLYFDAIQLFRKILNLEGWGRITIFNKVVRLYKGFNFAAVFEAQFSNYYSSDTVTLKAENLKTVDMSVFRRFVWQMVYSLVFY